MVALKQAQTQKGSDSYQGGLKTGTDSEWVASYQGGLKTGTDSEGVASYQGGLKSGFTPLFIEITSLTLKIYGFTKRRFFSQITWS